MENRYKLGVLPSDWVKQVIQNGKMVFVLLGSKRIVLTQWNGEKFIGYAGLGGLDFKKPVFYPIFITIEQLNKKCQGMVELRNNITNEEVTEYQYNEKI